MKRIAPLTIALTLAGGGIATAQGQVVAGDLSKKDARGFIKRQLGERDVSRVLLGDERAAFFSPRAVRVEKAKNCQRFDRSTVTCRFHLRLKPDKAHRKANWFPIRCKGAVKALRLSDGGIGGDMGDYKCVTVIPKD